MKLLARAALGGLVCALAWPSGPAASVNADQVLSAHIKDADGTTGQNTSIGAGVKTGHIQDGAVTDAKIAGPISASKIARYHVIVVAKTGGQYSDPIAAMNAARAATADEPFLVQVGAGTFDLGGRALVVPSNVHVVGAGPEATIIRSDNSTPNDGCTSGTVVLNGGSSIRDLRVVNPALRTDTFYAGVAFWNGQAAAENVHIVIGTEGSSPGHTFHEATCTGEDPLNSVPTVATLNNVKIDSWNTEGNSDCYHDYTGTGATYWLTNSSCRARAGGSSCANIFNNVGGSTSTNIVNSNIEGFSAWGCLVIRADSFNISNSTFTITSPGTLSFEPPTSTIINTRFVADGITIYNGAGARAANSQLPGLGAGLPGAKLVGCYDESFNPIPNQ